MAREYYRNTPIVSDDLSGQTLLSAGDFEGYFDPGFEVSGRLSRVEVRYFQLSNDVDSYIATTGVSNIAGLPVTAGDLRFNYDTDLYNGEINLLFCDPCAPIRLSGGFRYLRLNEQLNIHVPVPPPMGLTKTRNDLYGLQLGVDVNLPNPQDSPLSFSVFCKGGIFYGDTRSTTIAVPGPNQLSLSDSSDRASFVGEVGAKGHLNLTSWLSLDAGYQILFINGVALAGDQGPGVNVATTPTLSMRTGDLFYHGLTTSATVRW